ncbi:hypothetical protein EJB05_43833 [Eragrostis curvula]|uniref:Uncharacterized protein n=1 Tax=Eragrostis curvula TaxID=38414 RepID=A0A5J9TG21_9POAL|nr:hypothetical protein EJB05_43833 [Eragrostis curvula]
MATANCRTEFEAEAREERRRRIQRSEREAGVGTVVAAVLGALMVHLALHPESSLQYRAGVLQAAVLEFAVSVAFIVNLFMTRQLRKKLEKDERAQVRGKAPMDCHC